MLTSSIASWIHPSSGAGKLKRAAHLSALQLVGYLLRVEIVSLGKSLTLIIDKAPWSTPVNIGPRVGSFSGVV